MVQFLEKEHKNFEKILYKSMAFENCANFLKATNMLIGRNPKNDFRVKHPFINQEFHVMISELDKCAERKQSFSFFNVKVMVSKSRSFSMSKFFGAFQKMAQEFTAVHKDIFNMKTTRRRIKERIQRKLFTQDWFHKTSPTLSTDKNCHQYRRDFLVLLKSTTGNGRTWRGARRRNKFRKQSNIAFIFRILYKSRRSWDTEIITNIETGHGTEHQTGSGANLLADGSVRSLTCLEISIWRALI